MNNDRFLTRVFDKQAKKMLYVGDYIKAGDRYIQTKDCAVLKGFTVGGMITTDGDNIWFGDRFIPMQCTGLKDKNGKLIYEGDIVKSPDYDNEMEVTYDYIQPSDDMTAPGAGYQFNTEPDEMEIIGNKWENEKLLEVTA